MLYQRLCIVLLLLLFPINSLAQEAYLVAYAGFAGFQAPVWAPKDLGVFAKYGFNGDVVLVPGSVRQIQAVLGGSIHLAQIDAATGINAINQGADLVMIQLPAWASAIAQGYNDWLYDRFISQSPRLKGVALLAPQDPKAAAAELRRCVKELGFSAGLLPSVTNNRTPLYGSPVFHEIYDEAQRLDVPLTIHGGVSQNLGLDRVASFLEAHMACAGQFPEINFSAVAAV